MDWQTTAPDTLTAVDADGMVWTIRPDPHYADKGYAALHYATPEAAAASRGGKDDPTRIGWFRSPAEAKIVQEMLVTGRGGLEAARIAFAAAGFAEGEPHDGRLYWSRPQEGGGEWLIVLGSDEDPGDITVQLYRGSCDTTFALFHPRGNATPRPAHVLGTQTDIWTAARFQQMLVASNHTMVPLTEDDHRHWKETGSLPVIDWKPKGIPPEIMLLFMAQTYVESGRLSAADADAALARKDEADRAEPEALKRAALDALSRCPIWADDPRMAKAVGLSSAVAAGVVGLVDGIARLESLLTPKE